MCPGTLVRWRYTGGTLARWEEQGGTGRNREVVEHGEEV